jgi:hypothetical protein
LACLILASLFSRRSDARHKSAAKTHARKAGEEANKLDGGGDDDNDEPKGSPGESPLPTHRVQHEPDGKPTPKAQPNFTDADSRIMVTAPLSCRPTMPKPWSTHTHRSLLQRL